MPINDNGLPQSPFQGSNSIDWQIQGPLAGVLAMQRQGDYANQLARQQRDSDLGYEADKLKLATDQLAYEEKTKDVPLKDAERANKMSREKIYSDLVASGVINKVTEAQYGAMAAEALSKKTDFQLKEAEDRATPYAVAAAAMGPYDSTKPDPTAAARWAAMRQQVKNVYNIDLPETYTPEAHQALATKGLVSGTLLKHNLAMDIEKERGDTRIKAAQAAAAASKEKAVSTMEPDKATEIELRDAVRKGEPVDPDLVKRAFAAYNRRGTKEDHDKEANKIKARKDTLMPMQNNDKGRAELAAKKLKLGLPPNTTIDVLAAAEVKAETTIQDAEDFAKAYAGGKFKTGEPINQENILRLITGNPLKKSAAAAPPIMSQSVKPTGEEIKGPDETTGLPPSQVPTQRGVVGKIGGIAETEETYPTDVPHVKINGVPYQNRPGYQLRKDKNGKVWWDPIKK